MLSNLYNDEVSRKEDLRFIAESVLIDPIVDPEEDDEVDVEAIPQSAIDQANAALDQIVSKPDYDDTDLEDLMDDEDEEFDDDFEVVISEAISKMEADQ